jgi:ribosome-associated toxin RatA of RatAB toxin-antitoxin module
MAGSTQSIEINASTQKIFDLLTDFESYPDFMPGVRNTMVLDREADSTVVEFSVKVIKVFTYTLRFTQIPPKELSWTYVGGDFRDVTGSWRIESLEEGKSRATYTVNVDGGFFIPKSITTQLVRFNIPELLQAVKQKSEA